MCDLLVTIAPYKIKKYFVMNTGMPISDRNFSCLQRSARGAACIVLLSVRIFIYYFEFAFYINKMYLLNKNKAYNINLTLTVWI